MNSFKILISLLFLISSAYAMDKGEEDQKIYTIRKNLLINGIVEIESKIGNETKDNIKELIKNRDIFGRYASLTKEDQLLIKQNDNYASMVAIITNYTENTDCKGNLEKSVTTAGIE